MIFPSHLRGFVLAAAFGASMMAMPSLKAQTNGTPERFTAMAVNMSNVGRNTANTVEIVVERWSTDADRDRLRSVLMEQGSEKLLGALEKLPRVGYFRVPTSLGYDIHYARRAPLPDGGERVVLLTDRRIGFWEATNQPRSIDYPFTLIELRLNANGEGEGKLSIATKITADPESKIVVLEDYANQPVRLQSVKRERKS